MKEIDRIYIAGHTGMVGSAIKRNLILQGYNNLILSCRENLDLRHQQSVDDFFCDNRPNYVFLCAAKVGGIMANMTYPAEFIYHNLMIQSNVIHTSWKYGVEKLLYLGSSCIFPANCEQPIREEYLLSDYLEESNDAYAIAKIAGIKLCQSYWKQYKQTKFIIVMPCNLYGPGDSFDLQNCHVLSALVKRFVDAKRNSDKCVTIWGSGRPLREFLYVDDLAEACVKLMNRPDRGIKDLFGDSIINIGYGKDISIFELANLICGIIGYRGKIKFDSSKPDGVYRKLLDSSRLHKIIKWKPKLSLEEGIRAMVTLYNDNRFN